MKILLDQNVPANLRRFLKGHVAMTAKQMNWAVLKNGHLLQVAEREGFAVMIPCDQNHEKQQNNALRKIAPIVLGDTDWAKIQPEVGRIKDAVARASTGSFAFVAMPPEAVK